MSQLLLALTLAQDLAEAPLPLLGGRLSARFPAGAAVDAAPPGPIRAPAADERETRVLWSSGGGTWTATAYEQLETAGPDLPKEVAAVVRAWVPSPEPLFEVAPLPLRDDGLRACTVAPKEPALDREEVFVLGLFTARKDGSVQFLKFHADAAAAKDFPACAALARRICESVAAGPRNLTLSAGRRELLEVDGRRLSLELPEGFAATFRRGRNSTSIGTLTRPGPLGATAPQIGIQVGRRPRLMHETEDPLVSVTEDVADLFGVPVTWQRWTRKREAGEEHFAELILPLPDSRDHLLHVFASAPTADGLQALRKSLATLKADPAKP